MNNWRFLRPRKGISLAVCVLAALFVCPAVAMGGVPDWLRAAAAAQVPAYPDHVDAVVLTSEQLTTVNSSGEIKTRYREALKILRPGGRSRGRIRVYFDNDTRLTYLKAWSLPADGQDYEVKEKEAVESALPDSGQMYSDTHFKVLTIPAADPGNIIGYEYEQRRRPNLLQDLWAFQDDIPVRQSRFELRLPQGWEFSTFWRNHSEVKPQQQGDNLWSWEVSNLDAVEDEPSMPSWRAVAGRMAVAYYPKGELDRANLVGTWEGIGRWFAGLTEGRREITPEIQAKVTELTSGKETTIEKIQALAGFVQHDIRYVAIEIGSGGYQPHPAQEIFKDRYGDCKDKATLLSTMLRAIGVNSYYVLINASRGIVQPDIPTSLSFDHVILAIQLPKDTPNEALYANQSDPKLGNILYFDPTSTVTKIGSLPAYLQSSYGLLVAGDSAEVVKMPLLPPAVNRLLRAGTLTLSPSGDLSGAVREIRWGAPNAARRSRLESETESERKIELENMLGTFLGSLVLQGYKIENLHDYDNDVIVSYVFIARGYAKDAGPLVLLRPRVIGEKSLDLEEEKGKTRKYPVEFGSTTSETDMFDITLPAGFAVDELPPPTEIKSPFGEYTSKISLEGNVLKYLRKYEITSVLVPVDRISELKKFFREINADERASVVLKHAPSSAAVQPTNP